MKRKPFFGSYFIEVLKEVHYICKKYLETGNYEGFSNFLGLFDDSTDINVLNTILIVTAEFRAKEYEATTLSSLFSSRAVLIEDLNRIQEYFDTKNKEFS